MVRLEGQKIIIKQTDKEDLENIQKLWNNGEVMQWVGIPEGLNITVERLQKWHDHVSNNSLLKSFVVMSKDNEFLGELFYNVDVEHGRAGLDIKFMPEAQGKGYATEALRLLIQYVFENEEAVGEVWTEPSPQNNAARKLYAKCGLSSKERPIDMEPAESYWALTRVEWRQYHINKD